MSSPLDAPSASEAWVLIPYADSSRGSLCHNLQDQEEETLKKIPICGVDAGDTQGF